jgi:hypothetical protein
MLAGSPEMGAHLGASRHVLPGVTLGQLRPYVIGSGLIRRDDFRGRATGHAAARVNGV